MDALSADFADQCQQELSLTNELSELEQEMTRQRELSGRGGKNSSNDALKVATTKLNDARSKLANLRIKKGATSAKLEETQDQLSSLVGSSQC